jgi:hypothetical protein
MVLKERCNMSVQPETKPPVPKECTCKYDNKKVLFRGIYMCWPCLLKAVRQMHLEHDESCSE